MFFLQLCHKPICEENLFIINILNSMRSRPTTEADCFGPHLVYLSGKPRAPNRKSVAVSWTWQLVLPPIPQSRVLRTCVLNSNL